MGDIKLRSFYTAKEKFNKEATNRIREKNLPMKFNKKNKS